MIAIQIRGCEAECFQLRCVNIAPAPDVVRKFHWLQPIQEGAPAAPRHGDTAIRSSVIKIEGVAVLSVTFYDTDNSKSSADGSGQRRLGTQHRLQSAYCR